MEITHDIIAAVTGPGWKYGLSRILINSEDEGVVFIAGSDEPLAYFTVTGSNASRGTGTTSDGGDVIWRRRGSSCQYKLAKCKVSTETMTARWEASLSEQDTPLPEPGEDPAEEPTPDEPVEEVRTLKSEVPAGSASKVMEWVGEDVDRAQAALEVENDGQKRKGLTGDLQKVLDEAVL